MLQNAHAAMVYRQVMEQHHQQPLGLGCVVREVQPQHRCLPNVDAVVRRIEAPLQLLGDVARIDSQRYIFNGKGCVAPHYLHWLRQPFPQHRRTQHIVPSDCDPQRFDEGLHLLGAVKR